MKGQSAASVPPLLPLQLLLAPDEFVAPQISPDGMWISYIAPSEGAANLFVAPVSDPRHGKPITHYTQRGVQATDVSGVVMYRWHADSKRIIYPKDYDGDEKWDIHIVDIESEQDRNLTSSPSVKDEIIAYGAAHPDEVLIESNERHQCSRISIG
jgi:Tol biopolymer transport system component